MELTGKDLVINWVVAAGTIALSGDFRTVTYTPTVKLANATAGSDAFEAYLAATKDTKVSYTGVMQSAGTAVEDALDAGTFGTLIIQPEGTVSGKRKYTVPAFAQGGVITWPYADTVAISCDFQGSGTPTKSVN